MEKILISSCLLGEIVRYDAKEIPLENSLLKQWSQEGKLIAICPEVSGDLTVPRPPAEIVGGDGFFVLKKQAILLNTDGQDVTENYLKGAFHALAVARKHHIRMAIFKANSPSCGNSFIYDGTFSNTKIPGKGVTVALLEANGIRVFNEREISQAAEYLRELEQQTINYV